MIIYNDSGIMSAKYIVHFYTQIHFLNGLEKQSKPNIPLYHPSHQGSPTIYVGKI